MVRAGAARGPDGVRPDPRVHRPAAGRRRDPPAQPRRPDHDPDRARNTRSPAVPALLRVRRHRARLRRGQPRGDRRQGAGARDGRPRPALDPRGDAARRPVRVALAPRRHQVRGHQGDDRPGPPPDPGHRGGASGHRQRRGRRAGARKPAEN